MNKPVMNELEKCLDSQLWHACAGGMVHMPAVNSKVFYFPQGHSEHALEKIDFGNFPSVPPLILCRVLGVKFLADNDTDEVYAKIKLVPLRNNDCGFDEGDDDGFVGIDKTESQEKPASFAKTLTQSDANNGGGFSVPRYCAETIFPRLDYSADPPVQTIIAKDLHGQIWKFRHIYRGTPRRHLLTTGWSNFVNQKKLVAGDSIVFLRVDNGDLCVGIRRAKRGSSGRPEPQSGWNALGGNCGSPFGGYSSFLRENDNKNIKTGNADQNVKGRVRVESVVEAATLAATGQPFEVVYYPRGSAPGFCVKASAVGSAMRTQWCVGMRFKMAFETEDSSRISWFMGTISNVQVDDPIHWPNSPWRLLQVEWDEPDLLQNVKRVSPWLVELVSNMPAIHLTQLSPRKKLRVLQPPDFSFIGQFPMPSFPSSPLRPSSPFRRVSDNFPAGIQGARHAQFGFSSADLHFSKLQSGPFPLGLQQLDRAARPPRVPTGSIMNNQEENGNVSCLLSMGLSNQSLKKNDQTKKPVFMLFGQLILPEQQQQTSQSCSGETVGTSSSDGNPDKTQNFSYGSGSAVPTENSSEGGSPWCRDLNKSEFGLETGHCKVFLESEDVGRTLDLSALGSYEELYRKLAYMFSMEGSEMLSDVLYRDAAGVIKHAGDEPFSEFSKIAKRLIIVMDSGSDNRGR
ncbi:auxin response factor 18-like [Diospyros lotus]|uniref:auxin response factor 18-like n=1 Tax=Diospyros lotus TaxID=55363 RepID=UPI00224ED4CB|nr:auxin response factor 18-like [Diospyros lotus]XP_052198995.1 auxin response factor 18-like [Diospyros lotus]